MRLYVCGPTVYDYIHIGNGRPIVVFDVLFRLLRHVYGADHVLYARNITDVEDKINARALEEGISIQALTERTTAAFHEDVEALLALPPTYEPRATQHVAGMIAIMRDLEAKGHAYEAEGHLLFSVASAPDYGLLSGSNRDEMIAGARVEVAPYKKDPADFVLWKPSGENEPGWDSPWGWGRPGWHTECVAMSAHHLGETFDIHGGGVDLVFPHHENELVQATLQPRQGVRAPVDAQRLRRGGRREDVEVPRQLHHPEAASRRGLSRRGRSAWRCCRPTTGRRSISPARRSTSARRSSTGSTRPCAGPGDGTGDGGGEGGRAGERSRGPGRRPEHAGGAGRAARPGLGPEPGLKRRRSGRG